MEVKPRKVSCGLFTKREWKHFSNSKEPVKFLNEIIVPYVKKMRESKGLRKEQMAFVTMDVFTRQITSEVKENLQENNVLVNNVPVNMRRFHQSLD